MPVIDKNISLLLVIQQVHIEIIIYITSKYICLCLHIYTHIEVGEVSFYNI